MQNFTLTAQNAQGENSTQPLPILNCQAILDKKSPQLAVIFDLKTKGQNSSDSDFLPTFSQYSKNEILTLQQDFLWEKHCYELFLAFSAEKDSPYLEINFSPMGAFNIYHFDGYRTPKQMPPRRLNISQSELAELINFYQVKNQQVIFWQNPTPVQQAFLQAVQAKIEQDFAVAENSHRLVMMEDLVILQEKLAENLDMGLTDNIWLNPCAVFSGEKEIAYFAHRHANPPDFHDKNYWIKLGEL